MCSKLDFNVRRKGHNGDNCRRRARGNMKIVPLTHISPERLWRHRSISEGTFFSESPTPSTLALHVSRPTRPRFGANSRVRQQEETFLRHFKMNTRCIRTHNRFNRGLCLWLCKNFSFARRMPADRVQMKTSFLLYLVVFKLFHISFLLLIKFSPFKCEL